MRLSLAPTVSSIAGPVGALSFSTLRGRAIARTKPRATLHPSPAQLTQRATYHRVNSLWRSLPPAIVSALHDRTNLSAYSPQAFYFHHNLLSEPDRASPTLLTPHPTIPTPTGLAISEGPGEPTAAFLDPNEDIDLELTVRPPGSTHHAAITEATRQPVVPFLDRDLTSFDDAQILRDEIAFSDPPDLLQATDLALWLYGADMGGSCYTSEYLEGEWSKEAECDFQSDYNWFHSSIPGIFTQADLAAFRVKFGVEWKEGMPLAFTQAYLAFNYIPPTGGGLALTWDDFSLGAGYFAFILARLHPLTAPDPLYLLLTQDTVPADDCSYTLDLDPYPPNVDYWVLFYHPATGHISGSSYIRHTPDA